MSAAYDVILFVAISVISFLFGCLVGLLIKQYWGSIKDAKTQSRTR